MVTLCRTNDPTRKNDAGKDLIRAIFGKDAIAEERVGEGMSQF
jgi:hypothetical protein